MNETAVDTPWLTKQQAADRAQVSVYTIERWMTKKGLRAVGGGRGRKGITVRIHVQWLDDFLTRLADE